MNIFSRKTPAKPEMEAAASAALTPSQGAAPVGALDDFPSSDCTCGPTKRRLSRGRLRGGARSPNGHQRNSGHQ